MSATRRLKRSIARTSTVAATAAGIAGLGLASPIGAAAADTAGAPEVVNRETVQAQLSATGELEEARVYNQLTVLGTGEVVVQDPSSGKGLRDLDGFSAPLVRDGKAQYSITVDGREDRRTVADYTGEMPVTVEAEYRLDGERVQPEDVVGKSGELEVTYTVVNRTAEPTEITYKDGNGNEVKETVDLVTPYVGSLAVVLPEQFSEISAQFADVAGDGRGATGLKWSLVLFDPLGAPAQQLTYTAKVEDAALPPATLQVVPVAPSGNQVLANSQTSIAEGATAAGALTAGATKIDGKVLELRDGARKILDGVTQLADGARKLNAGLAGSAAPGAQQLADGGSKLADGLDTAADGSARLADGLGTARKGGDDLSAGLRKLADGNKTLAEGLRSSTGQPDLTGGADTVAVNLELIAEGLADLDAGVSKILDPTAGLPPKMRAGAQQLQDAINAAVGAGIGEPTKDGTLMNGLFRIQLGLDNPTMIGGKPGVKQGIAQLLGQAGAPGLPQALAGVKESKDALAPKVTPAGGTVADPSSPTTPLNQLSAAAAGVGANVPGALTLLQHTCAAVPLLPEPQKSALTPGCAAVVPAIPTLQGAATAVGGNVPTLVSSTNDSYAKLSALELGLGNAVGGLQLMNAGIGTTPAPGTAQGDVPQSLLGGLYLIGLGLDNPALIGGKPGLKQALAAGLQQGLNQYVDAVLAGISTSVVGDEETEGTLKYGTSKLADGSALLSDGAATLADKLGTAADGAGLLADGSATASAGSQKLAGGLGQLDDGGKKLADGLPAAADGAQKIADGAGKLATGLGDAAEGSGKIADGLGKVEDGQTQLADGANRLSGEGTSLLARSAGVAADSNAKKAAMLEAMGAKAADGALPYGLPEGASGSAAYSLVLAGANTQAEDNTTRGAAALALLALGSLSGFVVRRRVLG